MSDYEETDYEELEELEPEALDLEDEPDDSEPAAEKPRRTAQDWVRDMRMSADVNGTTVGVATDRVTPELLLATSKKLLSVSRREKQQDQKDSLQFQRVYGPAEYFAEHILRDGGKLGRNLLWKATNRGNLDFMQPNALDRHVSDVFYDSKLANMVDGSSPLELMDGAVKITRLGEGGVGDTDSAPVEMRLVQPSFAGFVDPVRCYAEGTELLTEGGWVKVEDLCMQHRLKVLHDGKADYSTPDTEIFSQSFPGVMLKYHDETVAFCVTPRHRMYVRPVDSPDYGIVFAEDLLERMNAGERFMIMLSDDPYAIRNEHELSVAGFATEERYGMVYCPTVIGGLVYCRLGETQGFWCGNSVDSYRVGLDAYFAKGTVKGSDGKLYRKMVNARTGKEELVDSVTAAKSVVTTADMFNSGTSSIYALGGDTGARIVDRKDVDYYLPRADELFSTSANLVPMPNGVKENRLHMGCLHPATPVIVCRKGRVDIVRAGDMGNCCETIGVDAGEEKLLPVVNTVSRFPTSRNCFRSVRLMSGRTLITSDSHKWHVYRNDEDMLVPALKLKPGDVVLRSLYSTLPTIRPFVLGKYVTADFAYALGLACRTLALTDKGRGLARIECPEDKLLAVEAALTTVGGCRVDKYNHNGIWMLRVEKGALMGWLVENVGVTKDTRKVPSCILSSGVMQSAAFIQGYTYHDGQTGQDIEQDAWILGIDNQILRDGIAVVLSRLSTDTLYRDSRQHGLCLQLQPMETDIAGMAVDVVKAVTKEKAASYMVDVDVDDKLFATANGIVTHNSKYALQAIPLDKPAPQLVRTLDEESGKDMPSLVGRHLGALYAKNGGVVTAVRKNKIDVQYDDGTKGSIPLYVDFPMNQKGYISSRPVVKAGQRFAKGDILSASNWTDDKGTAAIGAPLRTAWLSWKGGTYEDACVISESCAEKLRSTTMYSTSLDLDKTVKLGRNSFTAWKPDAYTKEQLENIGDDGIVKPGSVLKPGDPMILAVQTTEPGPGTLGKRILTDVSEKWEHDKPGIVTDVVHTRSGVKVLAKVSSPVEVGDKLSGTYGNKGVVSQIIPDDEMPQDKDGKPMDLLFSPLGLITRCYDEQTEFRTKDGWKKGRDILPSDMLYTYDTRLGVWLWDRQISPMHATEYDGVMYGYSDDLVDFLVTVHHRVWAVLNGRLGEYLVEDLYGKECFIPHLGTAFARLVPEKWRKEDYKGKIYCPSVETGYVHIRRNGKICCLGNTNSSQLHEALLGKVAHKTGKPEIVPSFYKGDLQDYVEEKMRAARVHPEDDLVDPSTGKQIKGVLNGYSYIYRLKHMAESKMSARGTDKYTADDTPASGSYDGAKRYGDMEISAMVGHGAFSALQDAKQIRGQANADFWREVRTGGIPSMPGEPTIYKKFFDTLKAAGVNVRKTQKGVSVFALTNSDVKELAGPREVKSKDTFDAKTFTPMNGGLFGQDVFGMSGNDWGYIQLDEPLPNPVMEDPLARLLRLKKGDFEAVVSGEKEVDGMKSAEDMKKRLATIDLEKEAEQAKRELKSSTKSKKDEALKRYRAIEFMRRNGVNPAEYMLDRIPVLPPAFRPVTTHSGMTMVADSNYLYAQMMDARDDLREAKDLPDEYAKDARANIYRKWKELVGLYEPENQKLKSKSIKGLLGWALGIGGSPKKSAVQRRVIGTAVDTVGRGVVVPDPRVKLNEIGIPEKMAFDVMAPFVQRELVRSGYTPIDAMKMVKNRDPKARRELLRVMETHPVQMNRAPTLHKLGIIGAKPVLVSGHAIHVNPSIVVPLGMDFDGDAQSGRVLLHLDNHLLTKILDENKKSEIDLTFCHRLIQYGRRQETGSSQNSNKEETHTMAFKELSIPMATDGVVVCADLADVPHGGMIKAGCGAKGNMDMYEAAEGVRVLAYDEDRGSLVWAEMSGWSEHRDCEVELVHLENGETIITDDDPRAVYGIPLDAPDLRPERFTPSEALRRKVLVPCMAPGAKAEGLDVPGRIDWKTGELLSKDADRGIPLNFMTGQCVGLLVGDGWWDKRNYNYMQHFGGKRGLHLADLEGFNADYLNDWLSGFTSVRRYRHEDKAENTPGRFGDTVRHSFVGEDMEALGEWLSSELGGHGDDSTAGSANKHLPTWFWSAPKEFRRGLVCGLISTDGSVSISRAKKAPQLMIGFCSTSLRLCRELRSLCRSLGVRVSITFSKTTARGNTAWQCTISTVDAKRVNLLEGMAHTRKLRTFEETSVMGKRGRRSSNGSYIVMPECVHNLLRKWIHCPSMSSEERKSQSPEALAKRDMCNMYLRMHEAAPKGLMTRDTAETIIKLADTEEFHGLATSPLFVQWRAMVESGTVEWTRVDSVEKTGRKETLYDLSVPGYETFVSEEGVVLSNTVNLHVPVSDAAREETRNRMFPEKILIAMRNRKIAYKPEKEYQQGLYIATRMKEGERPRIFDTFEEARAALRRGDIDVDDPIIINKK